jgi:flagellar hook-associated protein 2
VLQLSAASTGTNGAFTTGGFENSAQTVVGAQNAQVGVGTLGSGGYTVSSQTNTFTGVIPGVTFSVSAPATGVTVTVASDEQSISDKIQALVTAANAANTEIGNDSGQGAVLEGNLDVDMLQQAIAGSVSNGTSTGASLKTWGIDIDKTGTISFDPDAFAAAYANDPTGTQTAITSFATSLDTTSTGAIDPISGTITAAITAGNSQESDLNTQISSWNDRLTTLQQTLQTKYSTMETTLAQLQSQQTYLTSMLNSLNNSQNSNSSSSN